MGVEANHRPDQRQRVIILILMECGHGVGEFESRPMIMACHNPYFNGMRSWGRLSSLKNWL